MPELFHVQTPHAAWQRLADALAQHPRQPATARIATPDALDRVLAATVVAPHDLPEFTRSAMDGYAVAAADTWGASPGLPALLAVVGEAPMGQPANATVGVAEAVLVHTGSMIPAGADAVVMVEHTQRVDDTSIEVFKPVAEGEAILQIGEDVRQGEELFAPGHLLRPQDIASLLALGIVEVEVVQPPIVAIISSGDELVPPHLTPAPGQVRDVNSYALGALVRCAGGAPLLMGIVTDDRAALADAAARAHAAADIVLFSAGSSVSVRDLTAQVISSMGAPGILVHGVSIKPGKPTILALCNGKPVFGLPGNPVSAMVIFDLFVAPAIRLLLGSAPPVRNSRRARLARNLNSTTGREDHVRVRLEAREGELWAVPVLGKSNLIYTLVKGEGTVIIPLDSNGIAAGEWVEVIL